MTDKTIATINAASTVVTLVNVYEVAPERQSELAALLGDAAERVFRRLPGFVSVNIHRSFDGARVVNYTQWASKDEFDRVLGDAEAQAEMRRFADVAARVSPVLCRVTSVHAR